MGNYIKVLVLPTIVLVIGNSNSYSSIIGKFFGKKQVSTTSTTVNNQARKSNEDICRQMKNTILSEINQITTQADLAFCGNKNASKHTSSMLDLLQLFLQLIAII